MWASIFDAVDLSSLVTDARSLTGRRARVYFEPWPLLCVTIRLIKFVVIPV